MFGFCKSEGQFLDCLELGRVEIKSVSPHLFLLTSIMCLCVISNKRRRHCVCRTHLLFSIFCSGILVVFVLLPTILWIVFFFFLMNLWIVFLLHMSFSQWIRPNLCLVWWEFFLLCEKSLLVVLFHFFNKISIFYSKNKKLCVWTLDLVCGPWEWLVSFCFSPIIIIIFFSKVFLFIYLFCMDAK